MYAFETTFYGQPGISSLTIEADDQYAAISAAHAFVKANGECTGFQLLGKVA